MRRPRMPARAVRFGHWLDRQRIRIESHWRLLFVVLVVVAGYAAIQSYQTAHREAKQARTQSAQNRRDIDKLFDQRDARRLTLDESRYKAALASCRRQNVARRGDNAIIEILHDAFGPVVAAERKGAKETPLVKRLATRSTKIKKLTIPNCLAIIPNPAAADLSPGSSPPKG